MYTRICRFLTEAVLNLDTSSKVVQEHIPAVLGQLAQKLTSYVQAHPGDQMARNFRMLLMAVKSIVGN